MALTTFINLGIAKKLADKGYRHRFFARMAQDEIATRIRELREHRQLRQADLATRTGMKQSAISRIEQADYSGWTYTTLQRVSEALDVRLRIILEPMEDVIRQYEHLESEQPTHGGGSEPETSARSAFQETPSFDLADQLRNLSAANPAARKSQFRAQPKLTKPAGHGQEAR